MNTVNNIEKLNTELKNANWDDVFADENPDSAYDTFLSILTSLINKCLPLKKVKRKINYKSEWLTKGILISCVQKNNLFKKQKKTPSQENELTYKTYKNKLTQKCWHSSKVTIFCSGLCIENVIPFFNIIAPTILHIIMGKFILLTFTKAKAITKESYTNHIKCRLSCPFQ